MHWRYGLTLGVATGDNRDTLVYAYLSETKRDFDVSIRYGDQQFGQHDGQGLLRFGIGVEHAFDDGGALRASLGSSRAIFGGPTNITPQRPLDVALGFIAQP